MATDQLRAILFDLDNTLIDWADVQLGWPDIDRLYMPNVIAWLQSEGQASAIDLNQLLDSFSGRHHQAWVEADRSLQAPYMPTILLDALREAGVDCTGLTEAALMAAYNWRGVPGCRVFPDVPRTLALLGEVKLKLGIVTNASQPMVMRDAELAAHGLLHHFPACRLAAADAGVIKPHPRIFEQALKKLNASPRETVFIGDNWHADVEGAQGLGMRTIWRTRQRGTERNDRHARLRTLDDLPPILDAWFPGWRDGPA